MKETLDIAVVVGDLRPTGGQDRVALELARRWAQHHKVTAYCYSAETSLLPDVSVRLLRPRPRKVLLQAAMLPFLGTLAVAGKKHDIIFAHGGTCLSANFVLFHTCHPLRLQTMALVAAERGRPLTAKERLNMAVRRWLFAPIDTRLLRRCPGRAFAVSPRLRRDLARWHRVPEENIGLAVNGVDTTVFNPTVRRYRPEVRRQLGIDDHQLLALFVGGIWWEKGLHIAIQAIAQARSRWHLAVVGSDDDQVSFAEMAAGLGIAERVHFLGRTSQPEKFYGAADCLVLPSRFEGFPLVSLEAAASGLPVLISREGHPGELVDQRTGFVLDRTPQQFAAALDALAADPDRRRAMGQAAAAEAKKYTWDRQASVLERAFIHYVRSRP